MLVLSRDCNAVIRIGSNIRVKVLSIRRQRVKLGVEAPHSVNVWREEIVRNLVDEELDVEIEQTGQLDLPSNSDLSESLVCVVEDDPAHAGLIQKALARERFVNSRVFGSGSAALSAFGLGDSSESSQTPLQPFLVLLDFHLPDQPGLAVLKQIRQSPRLGTVPVIVLSADDRQQIVQDCLQAGANAFVPKADSFDGLQKSVGRIVQFWAGCAAPGPTVEVPN